jgi:protein-tyrosine phosphatase
MIPIVDMHCHLLAGLDDGPKMQAEAIEMCRMLAEQGVGSVLSLAHQNEYYPDVTASRIRQGVLTLKKELQTEHVPISAFAGSEIMVHPDLLSAVDQNRFLTIADLGRYVLIEFPHGLFVDLREIVSGLMQRRIRPILAHPEQSPELLFSEHTAEELVQLGCLFQLSTGNATMPQDRRMAGAIKSWVRRGFVHVIGSDGHSPSRRPPLLAEASRVIADWAGSAAADRICGINAMTILQGLPLRAPPPPQKQGLFWFVRQWFANKNPRRLAGGR